MTSCSYVRASVGASWLDPTVGYQTRAVAGDPTPIFVVGMPRCGSSLVEQVLSSNPQVFGGGENTPFNPLTGGLLQRLGNLHPSKASPLLQATGRAYVQAMAVRAGVFDVGVRWRGVLDANTLRFRSQLHPLAVGAARQHTMSMRALARSVAVPYEASRACAPSPASLPKGSCGVVQFCGVAPCAVGSSVDI